MATKTDIEVQEAQGFRPGRASRAPIFARELLASLDVSHAPRTVQQAAVGRWLKEHRSEAGASLMRSLKRAKLA